jgi:serine protease AprX
MWGAADPQAFTALFGSTAMWGAGTPAAATAMWGASAMNDQTAMWGANEEMYTK